MVFAGQVLALLPVMDGGQIRAARESRGLTQEQLAHVLGVGQRTVGNWERGDSIPRNRMGMLERFFAAELEADASDPLRAASDVALLSELLRRAAARGTGTNG